MDKIDRRAVITLELLCWALANAAHSRKMDNTESGLSLCLEITAASNGKLQFLVLRQNRGKMVPRAPAAVKGV